MDFHAVKARAKCQIGSLGEGGDEFFNFCGTRFTRSILFAGGRTDFVAVVEFYHRLGAAVMDLQNRFRALFLNDLGGFFQAVEAVFARSFRLSAKGFATVLNQSGGRDKEPHIASAVAEKRAFLVAD